MSILRSKTGIVGAVTVALVGAVVLGSMLGPSPSVASISQSDTAAAVMTLSMAEAQSKAIDVAPGGISVADRYIASGDLKRSGIRVGNYLGECYVAHATAAKTTNWCEITARLSGGSLVMAGGVDQATGRLASGRLAVVGGTGFYQKARGTGVISQTSGGGGRLAITTTS
ncbi:hypothetical protein [Tenggerimyces flavus]|uniref:Allene oxide cyclase barrel-like domain-containing protein n=1 Tax=Tenggerimyces flavus TaxID=1708749 RepID=A0ABV7YSI9_9ACTN|nr:hypothetical protein [Tenggerimyces flavus]MBM7790124.1 hypothetical protein [Tenggerimyces flavus]